MKILLLRTSPLRTGLKPFDYPPVAPPLGIMNLASYIREKDKSIKIMIIDSAISLSSIADIAKYIDEFKPDILGLSSLGFEGNIVKESARIAKLCSPSIKVVVGGPFPSMSPRSALEIPDIDIAVIGEGEETFYELTQKLKNKDDISKVRGIGFKIKQGNKKNIFLTPPRPFIKDIDSIPPVSWDDIELKRYSEILNFNDLPVKGIYAMILTSRGCPYQCIYCHNFFGKKIRNWSQKRLGDEIERLVKKYGVSEIFISDDIFNNKADKIRQLQTEVRRRNLDIAFSFPNGLRGDKLTEKDIVLLKESGCTSLCMAIESASAETQKLIRKNLDISAVLEAAQICSRYDILSQAFIMIGFPGESEREIKETVETVSQSSFDIIRVFPVYPYPGTLLNKISMESRPLEDFSNMDFSINENLVVNVSPLSDSKLLEIMRWARETIYKKKERREKLLSFYRKFGQPDHPIFHRGFWKHVLSE